MPAKKAAKGGKKDAGKKGKDKAEKKGKKKGQDDRSSVTSSATAKSEPVTIKELVPPSPNNCPVYILPMNALKNGMFNFNRPLNPYSFEKDYGFGGSMRAGSISSMSSGYSGGPNRFGGITGLNGGMYPVKSQGNQGAGSFSRQNSLGNRYAEQQMLRGILGGPVGNVAAMPRQNVDIYAARMAEAGPGPVAMLQKYNNPGSIDSGQGTYSAPPLSPLAGDNNAYSDLYKAKQTVQNLENTSKEMSLKASELLMKADQFLKNASGGTIVSTKPNQPVDDNLKNILNNVSNQGYQQDNMQMKMQCSGGSCRSGGCDSCDYRNRTQDITDNFQNYSGDDYSNPYNQDGYIPNSGGCGYDGMDSSADTGFYRSPNRIPPYQPFANSVGKMSFSRQRNQSFIMHPGDEAQTTTGNEPIKTDCGLTEKQMTEVDSFLGGVEKRLRYSSILPTALPGLYKAAIGYQPPVQTVDSRTSQFLHRDTKNNSERPMVFMGTYWEDPDFLPKVASKNDDLDWRRPGEVERVPYLFSNEANAFSVDQRGTGTCWLLAVICSLAERYRIIRNIIPENSYKVTTPAYDGVFHCQLWRFGRWEDVYVDDALPWYKDTTTIWGASNWLDSCEMWAPLLEKAYAKFMGSYEKAAASTPGDAFTALTGGVVETIRFKDAYTNYLIDRMVNALSSNAYIIATVRPEMNGHMGLLSNHLYCINNMVACNRNNCTETYYFLIKNQHRDVQWLGTIPDDVNRQLVMRNGTNDAHEFWIGFTDFTQFFDELHICAYTPDFDEMNAAFPLDKQIYLRGEWLGAQAGGTTDSNGYVQDAKLFKNPAFMLSVPCEKLGETGLASLIFQLNQYYHPKKDGAEFSICLHVFRVLNEGNTFQKDRHMLNVTNVTTDKVFRKLHSITYRYHLQAGTYVIIPSTMRENESEEFFLRILSASANTLVRNVPEQTGFFRMRSSFQQAILGQPLDFCPVADIFGQWKPGFNAGGQIMYKTFANNPQYGLTVDSQPLHLLVSLKQHIDGKMGPIGFIILKVAEPNKAYDYGFLSTNYHYAAVQELQEKSTFVDGSEADGIFLLMPGFYQIVVFTDDPEQDKAYCLTLGTDGGQTNLSIKQFHVDP